MISKFKRNITSWRDVLLFYRVLGLITVLPLLVKSHTLPGLMNRLTPKNKGSSQGIATDRHKTKIVKYTDFILGWGVGVWNKTCLKRSLVLYHFLRNLGLPVYICFGVRISRSAKQQDCHGQLEGHAWLWYEGDLFLETDPQMTRTYMETYRFPLQNQS